LVVIHRKGEITKSQIDREYPYQVELVIPGQGFGRRLDEMQKFCILFDYKTRPETRRPDHFVSWCFKESAQADRFKNTFGGERIDIDVRERRSAGETN
jgi:hypothetical protein